MPLVEAGIVARAHLSIAASYAPWLRIEALLELPFLYARPVRPDRRDSAGVDVVPVPSDEWFLPARLSEVRYHLSEARGVATRHFRTQQQGRGVTTLEGEIDQRLERLGRLEFADIGGRLQRLLDATPDGSSAAKCWRVFLESLPQEKRDVRGFPAVLLNDVFRVLERRARQAAGSELETLIAQLREIAQALRSGHAQRFAVGSDRRVYTSALSYLREAVVECHVSQGASPETLACLRELLDEAGKRTLPTFAFAGDAFEVIADGLYASDQADEAQQMYRIGARHAPNYAQCKVKHDAIEGERTSVSSTLVGRSWRFAIDTLEKRPSPVRRLRPAVKPLVERAKSLMP